MDMRDEEAAFTGHGERKFPDAGLLASSAARGWSAIAAEVRSHPAGEIPDITSDQMEITLALVGDGRASVWRRGDGDAQAAPVTAGALWLCPPGVHEDCIRIGGDLECILHVYLPASRFDDLGRHLGHRRIDPRAIRYASGLDDPALVGMGMALHTELTAETAGGRLLADSLSLALAARLAGVHAEAGMLVAEPVPGGLDPRRLQRVQDFIEAHLDDPLGVDDLAAVACLSPFHFARAFKAATGEPPHRYLAARRCARAKAMLVARSASISEIAWRCGFSSAANFGRAFKRATGISPAAYRAGL
jgi:AraC family transcriptional regulator